MLKVLPVFAALVALGVVATPAVAQTPPPPAVVVGTTEIPRSAIAHWTRVARVSGGDRNERLSLKELREYRGQALQLLIQNAWIEGEAALLGIVVTEDEVRDRVRVDREQTGLSDPRKYRKFLRESGFAAADIPFRIRLELLSSAIRERVTDGVRDPGRQQDRLDRFVRNYQRRWRAVTVCRRPYATPDCGSVVG